MKILKYWLPPIAWMSMIFYLSSKHDVSVASEFAINFLILKSVHVIVYAALYFLIFRAVYGLQNKKNLREAFILSGLYTLIYSVSDELHQMYVPNREGHIRDVFIDSLGMYLMYSAVKHNLKRIKYIIS